MTGISLAVAAAIAAIAALAGAAAAQSVPPATNGPYLWVQQDADHVVLLSTGTRHRTDMGWSATSITIMDTDASGTLRVHGVIEADCARRIRRTAELFVYPASEMDQPITLLATVPGVDWSPSGPNDGPVMSYLCEGEIDAGHLKDRVSEQVAVWRAGS